MGLIPHTRELLNISQKDLSEYLSINRTQLSMMEIDARNIPPEKFTQVIELNQYLEITKPLEELAEAQVYQQIEQQEVKAYFREQIVMLQQQKKQWQATLEKQRATYQKLLRAYHAFAQAKAAMNDKPEHQQSWLRLYYRLTKEKLAKNGRKSQLRLEVKLAKIASELEVLERYIVA